MGLLDMLKFKSYIHGISNIKNILQFKFTQEEITLFTEIISQSPQSGQSPQNINIIYNSIKSL